MKYRIKEYQHWYGSKFHVQWQLCKFFWVDYGRYYNFDTLEEAKECVERLKKEDNIKTIIHEIQN